MAASLVGDTFRDTASALKKDSQAFGAPTTPTSPNPCLHPSLTFFSSIPSYLVPSFFLPSFLPFFFPAIPPPAPSVLPPLRLSFLCSCLPLKIFLILICFFHPELPPSIYNLAKTRHHHLVQLHLVFP